MKRMRRWQTLPAIRLIEGAAEAEFCLRFDTDEIRHKWSWRNQNGDPAPALRLINVGAGPCFDLRVTWTVENGKALGENILDEPWQGDTRIAITKLSVAVHRGSLSSEVLAYKTDL